MYKLIRTVKDAIKSIEKEKGVEFKIKSLVAKNMDNIQWDLVLSADWFNNDKLARMDYLVNRILADFDIESMIQFSGIISYEADESNPLADILTKIQTNNRLGKYPDYGGYTLVEPHDEQVKWVIPLNEPSPRRVE